MRGRTPMKRFVSALALLTAMTAIPCAEVVKTYQSDSRADLAFPKRIDRFAPTNMTADITRLAPNDRKALEKIIAAARIFDPLYQRQIWSGNDTLMKKLEADQSFVGRMQL